MFVWARFSLLIKVAHISVMSQLAMLFDLIGPNCKMIKHVK